MVKKEVKTIAILGVLALLVIPLASAGIFDWFKEKVQGAPVDLNITVESTEPPWINVYTNTMTDDAGGIEFGPNEGPDPTILTIGVEACDVAGYNNVQPSNGAVVAINFSQLPDEDVRYNSSCVYTGVHTPTYCANYTCTVTMWWWDTAGNWDIGAMVTSGTGFEGHNVSETFLVGGLDAFTRAPANLTWPVLSTGATDALASNNPILLNNTGNVEQNILVTSQDLIGVSNSVFAIYANNFSIGAQDTVLSSCTNGDQMVNDTSTQLGANFNLIEGNYTINDGDEGQEQLYVCIQEVGFIGVQSYNTEATGPWDIEINRV